MRFRYHWLPTMRRVLSLLLATAACSRAPAEPATRNSSAMARDSSPPTPSSSAQSTLRPDGGDDAGRAVELPLLWDDPPMFTRITPKTTARIAEYSIARAGKDPQDAECVVMTFGPRHGGTIDENVKRWVEQFRPIVGTPRRMNVEINGMPATFLEVAGTYNGNAMANREGLETPQSKPGWRLIGAIVHAPSGLWFFKLSGPDLTVRAGSRPFEDMVRSARPR